MIAQVQCEHIYRITSQAYQKVTSVSSEWSASATEQQSKTQQ